MNTVAEPAKRSKLRRWWSIWVAGGVDHDAVLLQISEDSGWSGRYAFLIVISAAISLLGLLMPSVAVLIGAMLLSPLMMPIIGMGFGIATLDFREMRRAAIALGAGSAIAVLLSIVLVTISPIQTITSEIAGRTQPTLFDLLVALLSAIAGAYALIRGRGGTVVGVAIAIALMPPLVVVGFGIATWNWTVFSGSLLLFLTNAITIALTAALVARVYGFGSHLSRHHTGWQLVLFVAAVGLLSIPLGAALRQIAFQAVAQRQVRDAIQGRFPSGSRLSQLDIDYGTAPIRVRAVMLTPRLDGQADRFLADEIQRQLAQRVDLHVDQLQVSQEASAAEAVQISRAANTSASQAIESQEQAIHDLALIAGVEPQAVIADANAKTLKVQASFLPGLGLAGYRALESRADRLLPLWKVSLSPPDTVDLPQIRFNQGVIDGAALDAAAWASARLERPIEVHGGSSAQRDAISQGIVDRGGGGNGIEGRGALRWSWKQMEPISTDARPAE